MAKTFLKDRLEVVDDQNSYLSLATRRYPVAASQTFTQGSPCKLSSGLLAEFVNPTDQDMFAIAVESALDSAGSSKAASTMLECVLATPNVFEIEANFLGSSAADNVLAAGDLGLDRNLAVSATLLGSGTFDRGWYIEDTTTDDSVRISHFASNQVVPNAEDIPPEAGDTNARVRATILPGATVFGA